MGQTGRKKTGRGEDEPFNDLAYVKQRVKRGKVRVNKRASETALEELGLNGPDVEELILSLKNTDWYKSMSADHFPGVVFDVFYIEIVPTATDEEPDMAYLKYYVDDDKDELVIVVSCKKN